jgi:hypothetical protein
VYFGSKLSFGTTKVAGYLSNTDSRPEHPPPPATSAFLAGGSPLAIDDMAVNRIKGAFAVPKKGETFELRAGLVYVVEEFGFNADA